MTEIHPLLAVDVTSDAETARAVWSNLERLAESAEDPIWREMAREVVEGRLTASRLMSYSAYQEALGDRFDDLAQSWHGMSEDERAALDDPAGDDSEPVEQLVARADADVVDALVRSGALSTEEAHEMVAEIRRYAC